MVVVWAVDAFWVAGVACGEDGMRDVAVGDVEGALVVVDTGDMGV